MEAIPSRAAVPAFEGSITMHKARSFFAAITVLGLAGISRAGDTPASLPAPRPATEASASSTLPHQPPNLGVPQNSASCSTCPTSGGACAAGHCSHRSCWEALCGFFTYHRAQYTDINTLCCSCSEPARPPLWVYMLHPSADQRPPYTLPDLSKCSTSCSTCGKHLDHGVCPTCGK